MTVTALCLIESKDAEAVTTTQYTASAQGTRTIIDKFTGNNHTAGPVNLSVYIVPVGGAAGVTNLVKAKLLSAGECYTFPEVVGHTLNPGDFVATIAGAAASIGIRSSGRENT